MVVEIVGSRNGLAIESVKRWWNLDTFHDLKCYDNYVETGMDLWRWGNLVVKGEIVRMLLQWYIGVAAGRGPKQNNGN